MKQKLIRKLSTERIRSLYLDNKSPNNKRIMVRVLNMTYYSYLQIVFSSKNVSFFI